MAARARYRIGQFATLTGASIKRLRYYHARGLLVPALTDPRTGYRYYTAAQIPVLHRITELASLGVPLREIGRLVSESFAPDMIREVLLRARAENERALLTRQSQQRRLDAALRRTEALLPQTFVVKQVPALRVAALREILRSFADADGLLDELSFTTGTPAVAPGMLGVLWHDCGKTGDGIIDCEAVAPLGIRSRRHDRLERIELPATTVVSVLHRGPDSTASETYAAAWQWLAENRYALAAPVREWYLPSSEEDEALIELHFPIAH
jgi:DNA-binding transcriptional MerR regulator